MIVLLNCDTHGPVWRNEKDPSTITDWEVAPGMEGISPPRAGGLEICPIRACVTPQLRMFTEVSDASA